MRHHPTVLVVTHVVLWPARAGNELRIHNLIRWFRRLGFRVVLLLSGEVPTASLPNLASLVDKLYCADDGGGPSVWQPLTASLRYSWACARAWLRRHPSQSAADTEAALVGVLCSRALIEQTRRIVAVHQPAVVVAEYIGMSPCLDEAGRHALKIIDTHDVFSRRNSKVVQHGIADPFACTEDQERRALLRADVVLAIQPEEAALFRRLVPEREVVTAGVDFDGLADPHFPFSGPATMLIVASSNPANVHGVDSFLQHAWPRIRVLCPSALLRIVGPVGDDLRSETPGVQICGPVADLSEEYYRAAIVINPTVVGTGLKIKSVEALAHGKCLVAWPNGVEGLPTEVDPPYCLAQSWEEMATRIGQLLADLDLRRSLEGRARTYAKTYFSSDVVYAELATCLNRQGTFSIPH